MINSSLNNENQLGNSQNALSRSLDSLIQDSKNKQRQLRLQQQKNTKKGRASNLIRKRLGQGNRKQRLIKNRGVGGYGIKSGANIGLRTSARQIARRLANQQKFQNLRRSINTQQKMKKQPLIISTGSTVSLSGFDHSVTKEQIKDIFGRNFPLKSVTVQYDENGNSLGTAEIIFQNRTIALNACKKFDMALVDNREIRMRMIEFKKFDNGILPNSNLPTITRKKRLQNLRSQLLARNNIKKRNYKKSNLSFVNPLLRDINFDQMNGSKKSLIFGTALKYRNRGRGQGNRGFGRGRAGRNFQRKAQTTKANFKTEVNEKNELEMLDAELDSYHQSSNN